MRLAEVSPHALELLDLEDADEDVLKHAVKERALDVTYNGVKVNHNLEFIDEQDWDGMSLWKHVAHHLAGDKKNQSSFDYDHVISICYNTADQCLYAEEQWVEKLEDNVKDRFGVCIRYEHGVKPREIRVKVIKCEEHDKLKSSPQVIDLSWVRG